MTQTKIADPTQIRLLPLEDSGTDGLYRSFSVLRISNGSEMPIGVLHQNKDATASLELFTGKGGFCAIVTSAAGTKYFALPGSELSVEGIELKLEGERYASMCPVSSQKGQPAQVQNLFQQATVLGAGLATRFEPVSGNNTGFAKPAVPLLADKSVIRLIVDHLTASGFSKVFINTFYMPETLKEGLADGQAAQASGLIYIDETGAPSGTAGGLRQMLEAPEQYGFDVTQPILVVQGDAVTDVDFAALVKAHADNNALVSIGCKYVDESDVEKFGIVVTDQSGADGVSGQILSFQEKPALAEAKSRLANAGFYLFSPEAYPVLMKLYQDMGEAGKKEFDFGKHILPKLPDILAQLNAELGNTETADVKAGAKMTYWAQQVDGYWSDIGNPTQYVETLHDIYAGKLNLPLPKNASDYFENGVIYWPNAKAQASNENAKLSGNIVVAKA